MVQVYRACACRIALRCLAGRRRRAVDAARLGARLRRSAGGTRRRRRSGAEHRGADGKGGLLKHVATAVRNASARSPAWSWRVTICRDLAERARQMSKAYEDYTQLPSSSSRSPGLLCSS